MQAWDAASIVDITFVWSCHNGSGQRNEELNYYYVEQREEFSVLVPVKILKLQLANYSMLCVQSIGYNVFIYHYGSWLRGCRYVLWVIP